MDLPCARHMDYFNDKMMWVLIYHHFTVQKVEAHKRQLLAEDCAAESSRIITEKQFDFRSYVLHHSAS